MKMETAKMLSPPMPKRGLAAGLEGAQRGFRLSRFWEPKRDSRKPPAQCADSTEMVWVFMTDDDQIRWLLT